MVGIALGRALAEEGHRVWGLRRRPSGMPACIEPIQSDLTHPERIPSLPERLDFVVYLVSSDERSEEAYRRAYVDGLGNLLRALDRRGRRPRRVFFASSTAVFGQSRGEWVDEDSVAEPARATGGIILEGERLLHQFSFPGTAIRFAGLYGPDRIRLLSRVLRGEEACVRGRPVYTNRIHLRDAAGVILHLMSLEDPESVYIAADSDPADRCRLIRWLAERLGAPRPGVIEAGKETRTRGNKRCRNRRLVGSGFRFVYPTYREGYEAIIEELGLRPSTFRRDRGEP